MTLKLNASGQPVYRGMPLNLPPKLKAVLALLIRHSPGVVTKDTIIQHAWQGDATVSDDSVMRCISSLRRLLPQIRIESVYSHGYRLVSRPEPTHDRLQVVASGPPQVVESYLHAAQLAQSRRPLNMARALEVLRSIAGEHPDYIPARITLASTVAAAMGWGMAEQLGVTLTEAVTHLDEAERVFPQAPGLKVAQAQLCDAQWRFGEAARLYVEALQACPDDVETLKPYGWHLVVTDRAADAIALLRQVLDQRPHDEFTRAMLAHCLNYAQQPGEALAEARLAEQEHPDSVATVSTHLILRAFLQPHPDLIAPARRLQRMPDLPPYARSIVPYALARCGAADEVRREVQAGLGHHSATATSRLLFLPALVALGDLERAASIVEEAHGVGYGLLPLLLRAPLHAPLRGHPTVDRVFRAVFDEHPPIS